MGIASIVKAGIRFFLGLLPKSDKKIVFESEPDFSDNSRAFHDYLIKNNYNQTHKIIWCVKNPEKFSKTALMNVVYTSFRNKRYILSYLYYIATAKTVVYTHAIPPFINTKVQTVACLWHGTPLKHMEFKGSATEPFTFISSASRWCSETLSDCFRVPIEKVCVTGYPRCDLLFQDYSRLEKLDIHKNSYSKLILWMPTFRQSTQLEIFDTHETQTGLPLVETQNGLMALNDKLKEDNLLLVIKLHPLQDVGSKESVSYSNIKTVTNKQLAENNIQLYNFVSDADVLLTDYSSVYFDFLLLDRPIGFIVDDIAEYQSKRGFVTDNPLYYMPGEKIKTVNELYNFLDKVKDGIDSYKDERKKINSIMNKYTDDKSCERLANKLKMSI